MFSSKGLTVTIGCLRLFDPPFNFVLFFFLASGDRDWQGLYRFTHQPHPVPLSGLPLDWGWALGIISGNKMAVGTCAVLCEDLVKDLRKRLIFLWLKRVLTVTETFHFCIIVSLVSYYLRRYVRDFMLSILELFSCSMLEDWLWSKSVTFWFCVIVRPFHFIPPFSP